VFNLSGSEIIVILLLALVVLGPEKLPDALRRAGRTYAELKKMSSTFQEEVRSALDEPVREMRETADLLRDSTDFTDGVKPAKPGPSATKPTPAPTPPAAAAPEPAPAPAAAAEAADVDEQAALINRTLAGETDPPSTADTNTSS
jgi:sec-independent protein translocase protein TatB